MQFAATSACIWKQNGRTRLLGTVCTLSGPAMKSPFMTAAARNACCCSSGGPSYGAAKAHPACSKKNPRKASSHSRVPDLLGVTNVHGNHDSWEPRHGLTGHDPAAPAG